MLNGEEVYQIGDNEILLNNILSWLSTNPNLIPISTSTNTDTGTTDTNSTIGNENENFLQGFFDSLANGESLPPILISAGITVLLGAGIIILILKRKRV